VTTKKHGRLQRMEMTIKEKLQEIITNHDKRGTISYEMGHYSGKKKSVTSVEQVGTRYNVTNAIVDSYRAHNGDFEIKTLEIRLYPEMLTKEDCGEELKPFIDLNYDLSEGKQITLGCVKDTDTSGKPFYFCVCNEGKSEKHLSFTYAVGLGKNPSLGGTFNSSNLGPISFSIDLESNCISQANEICGSWGPKALDWVEEKTIIDGVETLVDWAYDQLL